MTTSLDTRTGLPDALRVLLEQYPRDIWTGHANFDGLTRFWLERHLMFRQVLGMLQDQSQGYLDGDADGREFARQTARLAGFFLNQLHGHHQIEDMQYFPLLSGLEPRLAAGFELLDADHHALDDHLHRLASNAQAAIDAATGQGGRDAVGALHARLAGFERFLDRHLTDEEDLVVPVILHHAPRF